MIIQPVFVYMMVWSFIMLYSFSSEGFLCFDIKLLKIAI